MRDSSLRSKAVRSTEISKDTKAQNAKRLEFCRFVKFGIFALCAVLEERPVSYKLVGGVKAHQGYDW